jgi:hypothetical protein
MRAWPSSFNGLRLRLSSGWYPLPSYVPLGERQRLITLLVNGLNDIDAVVELNWDDLKHADQLQLMRSLVVVRVPDDIAPGDEALRSARAKLGSVRFGLLHYEAAGTWPDVAWQEREVKAPLLSWLKRWLQDKAHPLAKLGIAAAPADELAELTPEPAELLAMLDATIEHRLRYRAQGMAAEDWRRSALHVAAERLAERMKQVPAELLAVAFDLARAGGDAPVALSAEQREAAQALARWGLAWYGGNDVLVGPLARLAARPEMIRQLFDRLPEYAWSFAGKRALREAISTPLSVPRAVLMAPELPYARWPALRVEWGNTQPLSNVLLVNCANLIGHSTQSFTKIFRDMALTPDWPVSSDAEADAIDATLTLLEELDQPELITLDFERGRLHRFDAIDRAWAFHPRAKLIRAYLRWVAITWLSSSTHDRVRLDVLEAEVAQALDLSAGEPRMMAALQVLAGDLRARRGRVHQALNAWRTAEALALADNETPVWDIERQRLELRCQLALFRLDLVGDRKPIETNPSLPEGETRWFRNSGDDELGRQVIMELHEVTSSHQQWLSATEEQINIEREPSYDPILVTTRAAAALELGDWARAAHLVANLPRDAGTPERARGLLLWTWIYTALGELDLGEFIFTIIRNQALSWDDGILHALSHRGFALVALLRGQTSRALEALATAVELEQELGLLDADLLQLELEGLKFLEGQITSTDYGVALSELTYPSPSFEFQAIDVLLRFLAGWVTQAKARPDQPPEPIPHVFFEVVAERSGLRMTSFWLRRTVDVLLGGFRELRNVDADEAAKQLVDALVGLATNDEELRVLLENHLS